MRPGVTVAGLGVCYGDTQALDGVDLTVERGSVLAVLGPSGCGKSTLLRAIAGLVESTGEITIGGQTMRGVAVHQRGLGLMFQDHALFGHRSVAGNVGFGPEVAGMPAEMRQRRVDELLAIVGLSGFGNRRVASLSGGEAQRVALARALAPEPRVLLLDEPLASLDRQRRDELLAELAAIIERVGQTSIYVTHDRDEAFAIADDVAIMRSGRIERRGTPAEVWHDPRTVFVARFLGHPNVIRAADIGLAGPASWVMIPPGAISTTVTNGTDGKDGAQVGVVRGHRFRGDLTEQRVDLDGGVIVTHQVRVPDAVGATVAARIDRSQIAWLDDL